MPCGHSEVVDREAVRTLVRDCHPRLAGAEVRRLTREAVREAEEAIYRTIQAQGLGGRTRTQGGGGDA